MHSFFQSFALSFVLSFIWLTTTFQPSFIPEILVSMIFIDFLLQKYLKSNNTRLNAQRKIIGVHCKSIGWGAIKLIKKLSEDGAKEKAVFTRLQRKFIQGRGPYSKVQPRNTFCFAR